MHQFVFQLFKLWTSKFRILKEVRRKMWGSFKLYSWPLHDGNQLVQVQDHKTFEPKKKYFISNNTTLSVSKSNKRELCVQK